MPRRSEPSTNPIRQVRLANGKTLRQFAHECGVELQALYLNECGVYNKILPSIKQKLVKKYGIDAQEADESYKQFVSCRRMAFHSKHDGTLAEANHLRNPVVLLREKLGLSRLGFAKSICVHPGILYKVEKNRLWEIPESLTEALYESGWPVEELTEIKHRYIEHARQFVKAS